MKDLQPIVMYTSNSCAYCRAAKSLLHEKGLEFEEINVSLDREKLLEMMNRSNRRTVPQIFFGDKHIGGYTDLYSYFQEQQGR